MRSKMGQAQLVGPFRGLVLGSDHIKPNKRICIYTQIPTPISSTEKTQFYLAF